MSLSFDSLLGGIVALRVLPGDAPVAGRVKAAQPGSPCLSGILDGAISRTEPLTWRAAA